MSKPRYLWWGFMRAAIRAYPRLKRDLDDLHEQSTTANLSAMPSGGSAGRAVENLALRQLPKDSMAMYEAVFRAVAITETKKDGRERMRLIHLMYWSTRATHSMQSAALVLHISEATAKRWHGEFVRLVARCYGFNVDTPEPK